MAINNWPDLRQWRELKATMEGDTAKLVYDIVVDANGFQGDVKDILNLYQG